MILTYIICIIAALAISGSIASEVHCRSVYGRPRKEVMALSWPAKQTLKVYNEVPAENQPPVDLMTVLRALDKKHGGAEAVTDRFSYTPYQGTATYSWNHGRSGAAYYGDYVKLYNGFTDITAAIAEREHTFAMAGISSHLEEARSLDSVLKEEAKTIREITAKVKEDMNS